MLNCPYIKCLEDAGFPDPCLKPLSWPIFACMKGCEALDKISGANYYSGVDYDEPFFIQQGYNQFSAIYNDRSKAGVNESTIKNMIRYEIGYDKDMPNDYDPWRPWYDITDEELENKMLEKFSNMNFDAHRPDFLVNNDLLLVRKIYVMLRSECFYVEPVNIKVKNSEGRVYTLPSGGVISATWTWDRYGNLTRANTPKTIEFPECEGANIIESKIWIKSYNESDKHPINTVIYGNSFPDELFVPNSTHIPGGEDTVYGDLESKSYYVATMAKIVPKDTSWCGPLNSGT